MKRYSLILLATLVVAINAAADSPRRPLFKKAIEAVPGRYIVVLEEDATPRDLVPVVAREMVSRSNGRLLATYSQGVRGFAIDATEQQVLRLADDPRVELIEEAAVVHLSATDYFALDEYWHLNRIDQRSVLPPPGTPGTGSYSWVSDGTGVDVYIVDTGIRPDHREFNTGQVTEGVNYAGLDLLNPPTQWAPTNPCGGWENHYPGGHGTAVASLVGGEYTGVAKGARLIPVKTFSCNPDEVPGLGGFDTVGVMWATNWILQQAQTSGRRSVVNMSFYYWDNNVCTIPPEHCDPEEDPQQCERDCATSLEANIYYLLTTDTDTNTPGTQGVVVVASANNQSSANNLRNYCYPWENTEGRTQSPSRMGYGGMYDSGDPSQPLVITVGGTQRTGDGRYSFPWPEGGSNVGQCVDIYAPAQVIHGAHLADAWAYRDTYTVVPPWGATAEWYASGTSFASPIVAGVAARLLQKYPAKTVREIWKYIYDSSTGLPENFDGDGVNRNDRLVYIAGTE